MSLDNEVVSTWIRLRPARMLLAAVCIAVMYLGYYVRDEVKSLAQLYVYNIETRRVITDYSFPTSVSQVDKTKIQNVMKDYMRTNSSVSAMFAYEFMPRGSEVLYQGRIIITHVSQSGKDLVERYDASWLPMNADKILVEKVLDGEFFYRYNYSEPKIVRPFTKYNLQLAAQDGIVCIISVPIFDTNYQVRGYLTAMLSSQPDDQSISYYVESLEHQAIELSQYLI